MACKRSGVRIPIAPHRSGINFVHLSETFGERTAAKYSSGRRRAGRGGSMERPVPFITRVRLRNFKSIAKCDVRLGPLTILVGPNGSGKSNFLEALSLLGRALSTTPYEAIDELGGLGEIARRAPEPAESFSIDIEATIPVGGEREHWVQ